MKKTNFNSNFEILIKRDQTHPEDIERIALFIIIAGNEDLFVKARNIYDFEDHSIIPEVLDSENVDFCGSSRALVKLGYNLFNGFPADIMETFRRLDDDNFALAMSAIKKRFRG
ncbi:DUF6075 family protein [Acetobacterium wieringae]|jgi:hypothetical protein|uniref:Uncharacterized protein n=1 Tax=Acetobacterium wieringae TaxID=52694 RepID=A0A1F2PLE4_9FIRM|nr:DUF6075 family protein [Acetobacterium wieringae]OFV71541.1 hypothetical protein ACWI_10410 [Acetobacterium wieringae]